MTEVVWAISSGVAWALALGAVVLRGRRSVAPWVLTAAAVLLLIEAHAGAVQWLALAVTVTVEGRYIRRVLDRPAAPVESVREAVA